MTDEQIEKVSGKLLSIYNNEDDVQGHGTFGQCIERMARWHIQQVEEGGGDA